MRRDRGPWYESDDPHRVARGATWSAARIITACLIGVLLLGMAGWGIKVLVAPVKGAGDVRVEVNSAQNRIAGQELSQASYNNILGYDRNLDQALRDKVEHPGDDYYAVNYSGAVKTCNSAVAQYNADAAKIRSAPWWSPELPYQIDGSNPLTDCQPNITVETPK